MRDIQIESHPPSLPVGRGVDGERHAHCRGAAEFRYEACLLPACPRIFACPYFGLLCMYLLLFVRCILGYFPYSNMNSHFE